MQIRMLASRFGSGGALSYVAGSTYEVANELALQFIGDNAAVEVNGSRAAATDTLRDEFNRGAEGRAAVSLVSEAGNDAALRAAGGLNRASFIVKPAGGAINAIATPATSTMLTVCGSPVPYYAIRLHYQHWGGAGAIGVVTGLKALIGASDDIGTLDFTDVTAAAFKKCVTPRSAGSEFNTVVTNGSPGWKSVTWAGAASVNLADPGAGGVVWASSDVIYERGLLDAARGVYPLLIRTNYGSAGYSYCTNLTGQQTADNLTADFPTRPLAHLSRSGDSVTTPSGWINSSGPNWYVEFFTAAGVVTVQMVGDSRFGVSSEFSATKQYRAAEMHLHTALAAAGVTAAVVRNGISGGAALATNQTTGTLSYWANAIGAQALPQPAQWLVYLIYSINDGALTDGLMSLVMAKAADFASRAKAAGQRVMFVTAFPKDSGFTEAELARLAAIDAFADSVGDFVFDPLTAYGDATGAWALYRFDSSHMTDAGYQDMASRIAAVIAA